jgi:site-specific DNA-methyltransferase (adenine-specific)
MDIGKKGQSFLGDTIGVMDDLIHEDRKVNFILTSPPYNMNGHESEYYNSATQANSFSDAKTPDQYVEWLVQIFKRYELLLEKNGVVIFNMNYMSSKKTPAITTFKALVEIEKNTDFALIDQIAWKKSFAGLLTNGTRLSRIFENVWIFIKRSDWDSFNEKYLKKLFGKLNMIEAPNNDGANELNKACFSSSLVKQLLELYQVQPNDIVLDNFMGTHTTAIACETIGCKWIGIEIDKDTYTYGTDRVNYFIGDLTKVSKKENQVSLFDAWEEVK